jgi:hypothetical protein
MWTVFRHRAGRWRNFCDLAVVNIGKSSQFKSSKFSIVHCALGDAMDAGLLPTGLEIGVTAGVAVALTLAGSWVGRSVSSSVGSDPQAIVRSSGRSGAQSVSSKGSKGRYALQSAARQVWARLAVGIAAVSTAFNVVSGAVQSIRVARRAASRPVAQARSAIRLTPEQQWDRAAERVGLAVLGAQTVRQAQRAAAEKLDVAGYGLERLLADLDSVLVRKPAPATVSVFPLVHAAAVRRPMAAKVAA